ncbi:MAG: histidine kinase [Bacteroidia bacterium]|nr:histidine kinase [Bacteroidia bacterium]
MKQWPYKWGISKISSREILFQVILHVLVFVFYSFDRHKPHFESYKLVYFLDYAFAAFLINYFLLPRFFYRKKYLHFFLYFGIITVGIVLMEELVLEQIYFPDTRGKIFPGIFACLIDVLPVVTILSGFKFGWDAMRKQHEVDSLKTAMAESELLFLKTQINPHFLFNNLNNLYSYAIADSPKTPTIILELSAVLRYMLYECKEEYVLLSKEIEQLENFTQLNELQIEDRGEVTFRAPEQMYGYRIAPLILIVFIENAFKHSQASQSEDIRIHTDIRVSEDGKLLFTCTNSFRQMVNDQDLPHGIGLNNVQKRLRLLYPDAHKLSIFHDDERYEVRLELDLAKSTQ